MKPPILGSFVLSNVLADAASFMDIDDSIKLAMASPSANVTLLSHRAIVRKIRHLRVTRNEISTTDTDNYRTTRKVPLDDNVELANKQLMSFLKTIYEVESIHWFAHDIDDNIIKELIRIVPEHSEGSTSNIHIGYGRLIASITRIKCLLARHPKKVTLNGVFAPASLITNDLTSLLASYDMYIHPLPSNNEQISTALTDEFLKSPILKAQSSVRIRGFLSLHLTFPAILRFYTEIVDFFTNTYFPCDMPRFGTIGYQEMPAILQYYHSRAWTRWKSTLCNINNSSCLEFDDIFTNEEDSVCMTFGVSLERNVNGSVDNAVVPEELVDRKAVERFKRLVKALDSNTSIESVESKKMNLCHLGFYLLEQTSHNYLVIHSSIRHQPNIRNERSQDIEIRKPYVDQSTMENILVKIIKLCSSIQSLSLGLTVGNNEANMKLTDRLFTNLLEHAATTEIEEEWSMDLQLSPSNMALLRENKAAGIFQNLNIKASAI